MNDNMSVEIIKASKTVLDRMRKGNKLIRVAAYCRVSTDSEDQLNSYNSQVQYYTNLIKDNAEWEFAGIFADEAISGTRTKKRVNFLRLIDECRKGDIDMIITKSIPRFARNTVDTLKYVRELKALDIAVYFEDLSINTLTMDGELILTMFSSAAQQEVETTSSNVKKGLKMKMSRGELVGFQGCLGYDYDKESKSISVNEKEAEIVTYIFKRYCEGAGAHIIGRELQERGIKTKKGSERWAPSTILGIVKNEKYKGDIRLGKSFTTDPISGRRLINRGEQDQFYLRKNHVAIVSEETFEQAQEMLGKRSLPQVKNKEQLTSKKFSRKYAFSSLLECGYCGATLTRKIWRPGTKTEKHIWHCAIATGKGKKYCPHCKGIAESVIEDAFLEMFQRLCTDNKHLIDNALKTIEEVLMQEDTRPQIKKLTREIDVIKNKTKKLVDMYLEDKISKAIYEEKYQLLESDLVDTQNELLTLENTSIDTKTVKMRIENLKKVITNESVLSQFDRKVFENIIEKVVVGSINEDGEIEPYNLKFYFKSGLTRNIDGEDIIPSRVGKLDIVKDIERKLEADKANDSSYSYHSDKGCSPHIHGRPSLKKRCEKNGESNQSRNTRRDRY
ncbi:recombinase family protein [Listeria booriae]|uniref:recombinase family protein n=1 Tax=Listeria booriae TaxID=1552123 RepID=UPI001C8B4E81|nr:recombinase family protein [Listeria booriae]